ncbi:hypothetical protein EYY14_24995, partial [Escherichia coli]
MFSVEKPEATPKENSDLINLTYLTYLTYFIYFIINNSFISGFAPIFPDTCYHLTHYWPAAVDIPVASDNPVHYADA